MCSVWGDQLIQIYNAEEVSPLEVCDQQSPTVPSGSAKILVVEDNDLLRMHASSQLESLGYAVPDGWSALERDFDLLSDPSHREPTGRTR